MEHAEDFGREQLEESVAEHDAAGGHLVGFHDACVASERRIADLIPVPATAPYEQGTVIAVGTGALDGQGRPVPLAIKAGDAVVFDGHIGDDVMFGGAAYVIMQAKDARRVEDVSAATSGQRDESYRPRAADEPVMQPTWHGPHRIAVWST